MGFSAGETYICIVSILNGPLSETKAGVVSEVPRNLAAQWIVSGHSRIASDLEIESYRNELRMRTEAIVATVDTGFRPEILPRVADLQGKKASWAVEIIALETAKRCAFAKHVARSRKASRIKTRFSHLWQRFMGLGLGIEDIRVGMDACTRARAVDRILAAARH
jgi:hypothetical protein